MQACTHTAILSKSGNGHNVRIHVYARGHAYSCNAWAENIANFPVLWDTSKCHSFNFNMFQTFFCVNFNQIPHTFPILLK